MVVDVQFEVEVIPPASQRSFAPRDQGLRKAHGQAGYTYGGVGSLDIIANLQAWVLGIYHKTARDVIEREFGPDPTKYAIEVDGVPSAPIESAGLEGSGIIAAPFGDIKALKKAYNAAWKVVMSAPKLFKRSKGTYMKALVVALNGRIIEGGMKESDWANVTTRSNIQIYSRARHSSPLESIHRGAILLAAKNAAKRAGGNAVRASFTYRNPGKYNQLEVRSITGRGKTAKGAAFTPLAVPVLELGSFGSNVTDYEGNIEFNIERGRKANNLIERKIIKRDYNERKPRRIPGKR